MGQWFQCRPDLSKCVLIGGSVTIRGTTFRLGTQTKRPTLESTLRESANVSVFGLGTDQSRDLTECERVLEAVHGRRLSLPQEICSVSPQATEPDESGLT